METLSTRRKYRGYDVGVNFTRAGTKVYATANINEGAEELMALLGFEHTHDHPTFTGHVKKYPTWGQAAAFMMGQKRWRH